MPLPHGPIGPRAVARAAAPSARRDRRWDALLIAVALYILTAVSNIQLLLPFLVPLRLGLLSALATIALLLMDGSRARRLDVSLDLPATLVLGILAWAVVTVPIAIHRGLAFALVTGPFWRVVLLFVVIVAAVRGFRDVERLTFVYFFGVVAICIYTLTKAPLGSGMARVEHITGNLDPNDFATLAVTGFPFGLYFLSPTHSTWKRLFAIGGLGLIAIGVVLSGSRGGLLAFVAAGSYVLLRYSTIPLRFRITSVVLAVLMALAIGSDSYWERMATILSPSTDYNVTADVGRTQIWKRGFGYALRRPITGVGAANFGWAEGTLSPLARRAESGVGVKFLAPHNTFVQILAELGFTGLFLLLAAVALTFSSIARAERWLRHRQPGSSAMAQALTATLIGLLVGIFFLSHAYSALLYSVLALALTYGKVARLGRFAERSQLRRST
jgi:O-antigen ligase